MPCWTSVISEVDLGKLGTGDKLKKALEAIGAHVYLNSLGQVSGFVYKGKGHTVTADGRITIGSAAELAGAAKRELLELTGKLKRGYSVSIIKEQARRQGWQVKQVAANKFQVIKH